MTNIRPVSDLKDNLSDISEFVHATAEPVFLTKDGYGDLVIMSMDAYEDMMYNIWVTNELAKAEREAELTDVRYTTEEVRARLKSVLEEE